MTPVKFGIVGIGGYGRTHVSAVEELEGEGIARLDAAVVIDPENHPEKLAEFASRNVRVYDTLDDLLEAGGVYWRHCNIPHAEEPAQPASRSIFRRRPGSGSAISNDDILSAFVIIPAIRQRRRS